MTDIRFYKSNKRKGIGFRINAHNIERLDPAVREAIESLMHEVEYPRQTTIEEWGR